jgi:hypothetical protein
MLGIN